MNFVSWNVNGIRACLKKGFLDFCALTDADVYCLQETKVQAGQVTVELPGYYQYWNYADKKGYSGTAIFTKQEPLSVANGFGEDIHRHEGRVITAEYPGFYLVCCYTPNAQEELRRLEYRMIWEDDFRAYLQQLEQAKPVILCGDLNVAHQAIDLRHPGMNRGNPGFSDEERGQMTRLLEAGFTDSFRYLHPNTEGAYSWWSYRAKAREKNVGWRIDYFIVSQRLNERIQTASIYPEIYGSDHCPVALSLAAEGLI